MKKRLICLLTALSLALTLPALAADEGTGFDDVDVKAWYAEAVKHCLEKGYITGTHGAKFEPDKNASRAMVLVVLYRQAGVTSVSEPPAFLDTPADAWYANALGWAVGQEIIGGYTDGTFRPDDPITREQLATVLWRLNGRQQPGEDVEPYADQDEISAYAAKAVLWAKQAGVLTGKEENFDPASLTTRAELATIAYRRDQANPVRNISKVRPELATLPEVVPGEGN